jgi:hypothetical protein
MAGNTQVTDGICMRLNTAVDDDLEKLQNSMPIMQVLSVKKIGQTASSAGGPDRYRAIVSDGEYFLQAMLTTQINTLIENGQITKHSIVRLDKFSVNGVKENKRYARIGACLSSRADLLAQVADCFQYDAYPDQRDEDWGTSSSELTGGQAYFHCWNACP